MSEIASLLFLVFMTFSAPLPADLKEIVIASGAAVSWQEFERMSGPDRRNAALGIGASFARLRPREAWASVKALPAGDDREFLMRGVLRAQAERDPDSGLREVIELPAGSERNVMARALFEQWAVLSPGKAAEGLATVPNGQARDAAMDAVLLRWVAVDAPAAARWAASLPATRSGSAKPLAVMGMAGQKNLMGATYDRSEAMQVVAFEWAKTDEPAALAWARSVGDASLRSVLLGVITGK